MRRAHQPGQVDIPRAPRSGYEVKHVVAALVRAVQQLRDRPVYYNATPTTPGDEQLISFKLTVAKDGNDWKWQVSDERSTVMDGTNGDAFDLSENGADWASGAIEFNEPTTLTVTSWIVLEADIDDETYEATNFRLLAKTSAADAKEVEFDEDGVQEKARLLIGKVESDEENPPTFTAIQSTTMPQVLEFGFLNGAAVKVYTPHILAL